MQFLQVRLYPLKCFLSYVIFGISACCESCLAEKFRSVFRSIVLKGVYIMKFHIPHTLFWCLASPQQWTNQVPAFHFESRTTNRDALRGEGCNCITGQNIEEAPCTIAVVSLSQMLYPLKTKDAGRNE